MKRLLLTGLICLAMVVWSVEPGGAWGPVGHRVVARIAANLISRDARVKVATLLDLEGNTRSEVADALADAAEWPDSVARDKYEQSIDWHFIDLGVKPNAVKDGALWKNDATAFAKLVKYFGSVKHGDPDELEPASDLEFLVHLVGDIHQPLHAATDKDRGGNCLFVTFRTTEGETSMRKKFHGVMDGAIIEDRHGMSDRLLARQLLHDRRTKIDAEMAAAHTQLVADPAKTIRAWIEQSHALAVTELYGKLVPAVPSFVAAKVAPDCHDAAMEFKNKTWALKKAGTDRLSGLIDEQLAVAGARLAAVLNTISE
jgi:hypothetical protein